MALMTDWVALEPDLQSAFAKEKDPLQSLADARLAGVGLRQGYNLDHCAGSIERFIERGMMRGRENPNPALEETYQFPGAPGVNSRIDIGTSIVNRSRGGQKVADNSEKNKEDFLQHSAGTHELFSDLFHGFTNSVDALYNFLSGRSVGKEVKVARESGRRLYGPAVFRTPYTSHCYSPHINDVSIVDKLFNLGIARFSHKFACPLCIQNATDNRKLSKCRYPSVRLESRGTGAFVEWYLRRISSGATNCALSNRGKSGGMLPIE